MSSPNLFLLGRRPGFEDQLTEMLVWPISAVPEVGGAIVQLAFADQDERSRAWPGKRRRCRIRLLPGLPHVPRCGTPARRDPATLALALFVRSERNETPALLWDTETERCPSVRSLAIACDRD